MKVFISFLGIILLSHTVLQAQIETSVSWDNAQKNRINQIKEWRKQNKQKLKELKVERKDVINQAQELAGEMGHDDYLVYFTKAKEFKRDFVALSDSLNDFSELDSSSADPAFQMAQKKADKYSVQLDDYQYKLNNIDHLRDSLSGTLETMAKRYVKVPAYSTDLVGSYEERLQKMEGTAQQIDAESLAAYEEIKAQNREKLMQRARQLGTNHFAGKAKKLEKAQNKLTNLKKKYSYVPNSNDLSTAKKANSLEDVAFRKRLIIGGTLQIHAGDPVNIDFNPR
ncbi:MAG: hypothetical protein RJQ09_20675 [Cyclobacteriaceae bacterium]